MLFDIHVHTLLSPCSTLCAPDILTHARNLGLDGVCITDHDTMAIRHEVQEGIQSDGLCVIFGMEYATADGDFLLFGPFEELAPGMTAEELLRRVERCGGVAIAAHPFRRVRPATERVVTKALCQVAESINGRNSAQENLQFNEWRTKYDLIEVGGSDAHTLDELGRVTTSFDIPVRSREDLVHGLKQGLCRPQWNRQPGGTGWRASA